MQTLWRFWKHASAAHDSYHVKNSHNKCIANKCVNKYSQKNCVVFHMVHVNRDFNQYNMMLIKAPSCHLLVLHCWAIFLRNWSMSRVEHSSRSLKQGIWAPSTKKSFSYAGFFVAQLYTKIISYTWFKAQNL